MILLLYLLCLPLFSIIASAFPCNSNAYVPTKIALYSDRSVVLECAYPNCQQGNVTFIQQTYPRSFTTRQQGYEYNIEILDCSYTFGLVCPGGTVDANEPNLPINEKLCCQNIHSNYTLENVVILNTNQEVAGGAVTSNGKIIGYDYISSVNKLSTNGGDVYQVQTRRLNCLVHETNNTKKGSKARAHAEPNYYNYYTTTTTTAGYYGGYQQGGYQQGGYQQGGYQQGGYQQGGYQQGGYQGGGGAAQGYYPVGGGAGASSLLQNWCFSDDMEIDTIDGTKKMVDLEMGDWVKAYSTYNKYDPVSSFLHRLPEQEAEFIQFNLTNDKILKITPNHLIYKVDCDREYSDEDIDNLKAVPSQAIHPNDCLLSWSEDKLVPTHINSISTIKQKGIFAPLTTSGNIVVNGVYTSCHSVSENYSLLKGTTQIMQKLNALLNYLSWSTEDNSINEIDIPFSTQILYEMSRIVVPDQKLFF